MSDPNTVPGPPSRGKDFFLQVADLVAHTVAEDLRRTHPKRTVEVSVQDGVSVWGLATVHRIVLRHGRRCRAEGGPGQGATISITLPAPPAGSEAAAGVENAPAPVDNVWEGNFPKEPAP